MAIVNYQQHIDNKFDEWLDNTDINNLGIVKWARELLPEFAYDKSPWFHIELFHDLLHLYNPLYRNKYERLYEFISFRESAKSTAANTLFSSYIIANNGRKIKIMYNGKVEEFLIDERTIVIISETAGSAEEFTVRIRDAFSTSERLRYYYRFQIQDALDSITGQWTRSCFKINNCWIQGVGSGQQIRGKVKGPSRPTLVIADDIYSEKNVLTEESRDKIKRWWNNAVMNSVDNKLGKVIVLGTILHDDTILVQLEKNPQWKTKKIALMGSVDEDHNVNMDIFHEFINTYTKIDWDTASCILPFDEEKDRDERFRRQKEFFDKVQTIKDWQLAWPERIDLYFLALKFKEAVHNQSVDGFYQEYFHITKSPDSKAFRKEYFQTLPVWELKYEHGYNWIRGAFTSNNEWALCNIEFGVDLAGVGKDEAVITVVASLSDIRILVLHQAYGKWSIRDDTHMDTSADRRINKIIEAQYKPSIRKVGVVDECFRLAKRFNPSAIKIGMAAEEELIVNEMRRVFQENFNYTTMIVGRPQTVREGKKEIRIQTTLLPYYQTRMVYHNIGMEKLEYQLEYLGKASHDDCADSLEAAVWNISFPEDLPYTFFTPVEDKEDVAEWLMSHKANNKADWRTLF